MAGIANLGQVLDDYELTVAELAAKAEVAESTIYRILAGGGVHRQTARKLARALGIPLKTLMNGEAR